MGSMKIRPFDWRDLPTLLRYRHRGLFFDNASVLTRGEMLVPTGALLSYFAPATGIFTFLCADPGDCEEPLLGQINHSQGAQLARLSFLAPESALDSTGLNVLLEAMIRHLGPRGALHLLAEVDERTPAFEALRKAGFALYVRQRVWQFKGEYPVDSNGSLWRAGKSRDVIAVRSLYNTLVPGLAQQVEPIPSNHLHGLVYEQEGEILAYAELRYGSRGIWIQPFIHPDVEKAVERIEDLLGRLLNRRSRPIYICVRSYQSWLEHAFEELEAEAGPVQAVMVKHLAIAKRVTPSLAIPALEGGQGEASVPFVRSEMNSGHPSKK
jgi:hypothetical protein